MSCNSKPPIRDGLRHRRTARNCPDPS
jgi:hypothetical protein